MYIICSYLNGLKFTSEKSLEKAIDSAGGIYQVKDLDDGALGLSLIFPKGGERDE